MRGSRVEDERNQDRGARSPAVTSAPAQATHAGGVQKHATSGVMRLQAVAGNRATAGAIARMRAGEGTLQRLAYDDPPSGWGTVTIKRSKEGKDGVYFIDSGTDRIVVKPMEFAATTEYAGQVMQQAMGIDAPLTKTYAAASTEGQQIAALLSTAPVKNAQTPTETQDAINKSHYFLVMSKVEGKSIQRLDDVEAKEFISNNAALQSVGRIMVADAFLGNGDRLLASVNLGNFFYAVATATAPGVVRTIDNDSAFEAIQYSAGGKLLGNLSWKLGVIEDLIDPAKRNVYINLFLAKFRAQQVKLGNATALAAYDARFPFARRHVSLGVDAGLTDLAEVFKANIDLVRAVAFSAEPQSRDKRDPDEAKGVAHYIRARRLEGTTQTKAVAKLKDYLEYRARRNRTPTGRKWVARVSGDVGFSFA